MLNARFNPKRRDHEEILRDTARNCTEGINKTKVMYEGNLSFAQTKSYLQILLDNWYLDKYGDDNHPVYKTTPKGLVYADTHDLLIDFLSRGGSKDLYIDPKLQDMLQGTTSQIKHINASLNGLLNGLDSIRVIFEPGDKSKTCYRSKQYIIEEILNTSADKVRKTKIMYAATLSFKQLNEYLLPLLSLNMIDITDFEKKKMYLKKLSRSIEFKSSDNILFKTTNKGTFFATAHELQRYLLTRWGNKDPFKEAELIQQINVAMSSIISVKKELEEKARGKKVKQT